MKIIGKFYVRNVNKRIKTRDTKIKQQAENIQELAEKLQEKDSKLRTQQQTLEVKDQKLEETNQKLDCALKDNLREQKLKWYYKNKGNKQEINLDDDADLVLSKFKDLNKKIRLLENQKLEIEEKLIVFINGEEIRTFKDGKYIDKVRMLYEDLLCTGVSTNNVEKVIRKVLTQLGELKLAGCQKALLLSIW